MNALGKHRQRGLVLLISQVLVLLLGLLGVSVMGSATRQERMAGNLTSTLQGLEQAQQVLRWGEAWLQGQEWPLCEVCLPPPEAGRVTAAGVYAGTSSGLYWQAGAGGFYLVQSLGPSTRAAQMPAGVAVNLYRITAVSRHGAARSVLESVIAQPVGPGPQQWHRILWRQVYQGAGE